MRVITPPVVYLFLWGAFFGGSRSYTSQVGENVRNAERWRIEQDVSLSQLAQPNCFRPARVVGLPVAIHSIQHADAAKHKHTVPGRVEDDAG